MIQFHFNASRPLFYAWPGLILALLASVMQPAKADGRYAVHALMAGENSMFSVPTAVNDQGLVAGYAWRNSYGNSTGYYALLWTGTTKESASYEHQPPARYSSQAFDINARGEMVGVRNTLAGSNWLSLPAVWQGNGMRYLPVLGPGSRGSAFGINDLGQVVGESGNAQGIPRATLWNGLQVLVLDNAPGTRSSSAREINNRGQVVGNVAGVGGMLWDSGVFSVLPGLSDFPNTTALDINEAGHIAGYARLNGPYRAVMWQTATTAIPLPPPLNAALAFSTYALALNNLDQVVGCYNDMLAERSLAVLWEGDVVTDLNGFLSAEQRAAGWQLSCANGISDTGIIVAEGRGPGSTRQAFVLKPLAAAGQ